MTVDSLPTAAMAALEAPNETGRCLGLMVLARLVFAGVTFGAA